MEVDQNAAERPDSTRLKGWKGLKGKLFAKEHKDSRPWHTHSERGSSPQQEEEVEDFLRPSTAAAAAKSIATPKLDISAAKQSSRLSGSTASAASSLSNAQSPAVNTSNHAAIGHEGFDPDEKWKPTKPSRRPGLTVGFTSSAPKIIGEGGDEAETPAAEVSSRHGHNRTKSSSVSRPRLGSEVAVPPRKPVPSPPAPSDRLYSSGSNFKPTVLDQIGSASNKSKTQSRTGSTAAMRRDEDEEVFRPLARVPTGLAATNQVLIDDDYDSSDDDDDDTQYRRPNDLKPPGAGRFANLRSSPEPPKHGGQQRLSHNSSPDPIHQRAPERQPRLPNIELNDTGSSAPQRRPVPSQQSQSPSPGPSPNAGLRRAQPPDRLPVRNRVDYTSPQPSPAIISSMKDSLNLENLHPSLSRTSAESSRSASDLSQPSSTPPHAAFRRSISPNAFVSQQGLTGSQEHLSPPLSSHSNIQAHSSRPTKYLGSQDSLVPPSESFAVDQNTSKTSQASNAASIPRPLLAKQYSSNASYTDKARTFGADVGAFSAVVEPLKDVFQLAAQTRSRPSLDDWLDAATWWFLTGRTGLEDIVQRQSLEDPTTERSARRDLHQQHVHLAKTWWILNEIDPMFTPKYEAQASALLPHDQPRDTLPRFELLRDAFGRVCASMGKRDILPRLHTPLHSSIDTTIWLDPPTVSEEAAWVLRSQNFSSSSDKGRSQSSIAAHPLGDSEKFFFYGRAFAQASIAIADDEAEQSAMPCVLSLVRERGNSGLGAVISSQSSLLRVEIFSVNKYGITWDHVRWESEYNTIRVKLPRNLRLLVRCLRRDYESLSRTVECDRQMMRMILVASNEVAMQKFTLRTFQFNASANSISFPQDSKGQCPAIIIEQTAKLEDGSMRKAHVGKRLAVSTDPHEKHVSCVSISLEDSGALQYEYGPEDPNWPSVMRIKTVGQSVKQTMNVSFDNTDQRDLFRDLVTDTVLSEAEEPVLKLPLRHLSISSARDLASLAFQLPWRSVQVIDSRPTASPQSPILSNNSLRTMLLDRTGSIIDRFNLPPGELKLRLEPQDRTCLSFLRQPRQDITISAGPSHSHPDVTVSLHRISQMMQTTPTIISYHFQTLPDLHAFEAAITGFEVRHDSVIQTWGISRRRKGVPIYRSWDTNSVRIQIVAHSSGETQLVVFFTDYILADCLNFQLKETDVYERAESKTGQPCVKLVDAKFILPGTGRHGERDQFEDLKEGEVRQREAELRFVSLDDLEFAAEHEDITLTFADEDERETFIKALPAPISTHRKFGINALKRG